MLLLVGLTVMPSMLPALVTVMAPVQVLCGASAGAGADGDCVCNRPPLQDPVRARPPGAYPQPDQLFPCSMSSCNKSRGLLLLLLLLLTLKLATGGMAAALSRRSASCRRCDGAVRPGTCSRTKLSRLGDAGWQEGWLSWGWSADLCE